jgi:hypothetical protein
MSFAGAHGLKLAEQMNNPEKYFGNDKNKTLF